MKKTRITAVVVALVVLVAGLWMYRRADAREATTFRFAPVAQGDLKATVSATGALSAVRTVQVGTQVSGQVSAIYVDFNDHVKKGQLLARIDPTLAQQAVQDAQAGVDRAAAQLDQAKQDYDRNKSLYDQKVITASEFGTTQSGYAVARANMASAQVALQRARQNLGYTNIYAPIDGVIVERNVDVGQTVAASFSAPQLFLIANDLSQMQILASVDESDIGQIHEGQPATFTVQAYPDQSFTGTVQQVRLQSTTQDNVVNYTAVVTVNNPSGKLMPGMTATVQFLTGEAKDALLVPNAALRFRPTADMMAKSAGATGRAGTARDSAAARRWSGSRTGSANGTAGAAGAQASRRLLWYVNDKGVVTRARVTTGLTDGQYTVVTGPDVKAGMQVITGVTSGGASGAASAAAAPAANPLQPQRRGGMRGPGGF